MRVSAGSEKEGFRITVEFIEQMLEEFREQRKFTWDMLCILCFRSVFSLRLTLNQNQFLFLSEFLTAKCLYDILKILVLITVHVDVIFFKKFF